MTALARLLLEQCRARAHPGRLTFAKAAAARISIHRRLANWAAMDRTALCATDSRTHRAQARRRSAAACRHAVCRVLCGVPGGMKIEPFHAFCQSLLRRFPLEAELPPHFQLIEDRDAAEMLRAARGIAADRRAVKSFRPGRRLSPCGRAHGRGAFVDLLGEFLRERRRLGELEARMGSLQVSPGRLAGAPVPRRHGNQPSPPPAPIRLWKRPGAKNGPDRLAKECSDGSKKRGSAMTQWL